MDNFKLNFDPDIHQYTDDEGHIYISVTQFLDKFHAHFDDVQDFWLYYKAIQYSSNIDKENKIKKFDKVLNNDVEQYYLEHLNSPFLFEEDACSKWTKLGVWKFKFDFEGFRDLFSEEEKFHLDNISQLIKIFWKNENLKSTIKGTRFHNFKEKQIYDNQGVEYKGKFYGIDTSFKDLYNLKSEAVYPELKLYNEKYKIAGTSDMITISENKKIKVYDIKTNKEIKTSNSYAKMFYPVEHLHDCEYSKYALQLSLYGWMLEQFGYEVEELEFEHFELGENDIVLNSTIYKCPYLKKEVEAMLNYYF